MPDATATDFFTTKPPTARPPVADSRNPAQRNNNPGNIRDTNTGEFRSFKSPQEGWRALREDLTAKLTGKTKTGLTPNSTLYDFAKVYAPERDRNDPKSYAEFVANGLKIKPDTPIGRLGDKVDQFAKVVATREGFFDYPKPSKQGRPSAPSAGPASAADFFGPSAAVKPEPPKRPPEPSNWLTESVFRPSGSDSFHETTRKYLDPLRKHLPESLRDNYAVQLAEEFATLPAEIFEFATSPAGIALGALHGLKYIDKAAPISKVVRPINAAIGVGFGLQQGAQAVAGAVQIATGDHSPQRVAETISAAAFGAFGLTVGSKVWRDAVKEWYGPDLEARTAKKEQIIKGTDLTQIKEATEQRDPSLAISKFMTMPSQEADSKLRTWMYRKGPRNIAAMLGIRRNQLGEISMDLQRDRGALIKVAKQETNFKVACLRKGIPEEDLKIERMGFAIQNRLPESDVTPAMREKLGIYRDHQRNQEARLRKHYGDEIPLQDAESYINQAWDMNDLRKQIAERKGMPADNVNVVLTKATRGIMRDRNLTRRVIPDYKTGMEGGIEIDGDNYKLKPRYDNIVDVMKARDAVLAEAIANKEQANMVRSMGGLLNENEVDQLGLKGFYKKAPEATTLAKATYAGKLPSGDPYWEKLPVWVHPDLEMLIKANFDKSYTAGEPILANVELARNAQKKFALNFSLFHFGAISEQAQAANALSQHPLKTLQNTWFLNPENAKGWANALWRIGGKKGSAPFDPPSLRPHMQGTFMDMIEHGVNVMNDDHRHAAMDWLKDITKANEAGESFFKSTGKMTVRKAAQLATAIDEPLWDFYHQGAQATTWLNLMEDEIGALKTRVGDNPSELQIKEAKRSLATFINNSYGSIDMQDLLMSPRARYWANMLLLAPAWTMSNLRTPLQSFENATGTRLASKWAAGAALSWFIGLQMINYMSTKYYGMPDKNGKTGGHFTWDNPGPPLIVGGKVLIPNVNALKIAGGWNKDDQGRNTTERYYIQAKNFAEPFKLMLDPPRYIGGKAGGLIDAAAVQLTGHELGSGYEEIDLQHNPDFWSKKQLLQRIAAATGLVMPISIRPYVKMLEHRLDPTIVPRPNITPGPLGVLGLPVTQGASAGQLASAFKIAAEAGDHGVMQDLAVVARMNHIPWKNVMRMYHGEVNKERKERRLVERTTPPPAARNEGQASAQDFFGGR